MLHACPSAQAFKFSDMVLLGRSMPEVGGLILAHRSAVPNIQGTYYLQSASQEAWLLVSAQER